MAEEAKKKLRAREALVKTLRKLFDHTVRNVMSDYKDEDLNLLKSCEELATEKVRSLEAVDEEILETFLDQEMYEEHERHSDEAVDTSL